MSKMLRGRATTFTTDQLTGEFISGRQLLAAHQFGSPAADPIESGALEVRLTRTLPGPVDPRTLLISEPGCIVGEVHKTPGQFTGSGLGGAAQSDIADEGTLTVTVGGSVSGVIDVTGDVDTIEVALVAGHDLFLLAGRHRRHSGQRHLPVDLLAGRRTAQRGR